MMCLCFCGTLAYFIGDWGDCVYIKPLPKSWLIHSIIYEGIIEGKDDYGNPQYAKPIEIKHVRYDSTTVFSRDSTQSKIVAEGVIFVDAVNSSPIPTFTEESKINFEGRELTLKKIIPCYQPTKNIIHHWELEVI